jgi:hypothetical protein
MSLRTFCLLVVIQKSMLTWEHEKKAQKGVFSGRTAVFSMALLSGKTLILLG